MSLLLRTVTRGYRKGILPPRGTGVLFDRTPAWIWGGLDVTVDTEFGPMLLPLRDHGPRQILAFGRPRNEFHETKLLGRLAERIECAIDIGANVGWFTLVLGGHGVQVQAFEPNKHVFPYLRSNARDLDRVTVHEQAVGEQVGSITFFEAASSDLSSASRRVGTPVEVEMTTVDTLLNQTNCRPDLVKCDVEGGELQVLRGAKALRASEDAPLWLLEVVERFLVEQGSTYEDLEAETKGSAKFSVDSTGRWAPLASFADLRGTSRNVLVVPPGRRDLVADLVG